MDRDVKLGDRIRALREQSVAYQSLRQFAAALGRSPSWVSKLERNLEAPAPETILQIAKILNADSAELLQLAGRLDPEVEQSLALRYAEVHGLLRTIKDMSSDKLERLERKATEISGEE